MCQRLAEVLGAEEARTLMEHLPPVGWADIATKRDVEHAVTVLDLKFRAELHRELRLHTFAILGGGSVMATLGVALVRLV